MENEPDLPASPLTDVRAALDKGGESLLQRAKVRWYLGEWESLAALDAQAIANDPARERIALLVACAHAQLGGRQEAEHWLRAALGWGCPPRLAAHARAVREITRLGLLPQAAGLIDDTLKTTSATYDRGRQQAQIEMLRTELELVRHELGIALKRAQVGPGTYAPAREDLANRSVSQLGQDLWVLEQTGYKHGGFFVEFGATDGVSLSNTYLLETEFGWGGLCAEPNPTFFEQLRRNRRCGVSRACIGARSGEEVEFVFADAYGGMMKHIGGDMHEAKRRSFARQTENVTTLRTLSLNDFLEKNSAPRNIDYISVDTEGSELEIIEQFPFYKWDIFLWTIEHNFSKNQEKIENIFHKNGYKCLIRHFDSWFFKI